MDGIVMFLIVAGLLWMIDLVIDILQLVVGAIIIAFVIGTFAAFAIFLFTAVALMVAVPSWWVINFVAHNISSSSDIPFVSYPAVFASSALILLFIIFRNKQ